MFSLVVVGGVGGARNTCQSENTENDEERRNTHSFSKTLSTFLREKPKVALKAIHVI